MSFGLTPRRAAWMLTAAESRLLALKLSDGTLVASEVASSVLPVRVRLRAPTTWIGAALSSALTPTWRVPVTMTSETSPVVDVASAA